ncbi:MAG: type II toxin-antitoxin system death-on-curing family toxin [Acidianus sp.]
MTNIIIASEYDSIMMENKLQMILRSLDKDFIIWLNQQIINEDPSSTFGLVNPDNIDGAIYSAIFDLEENHSISRSLAVLIHHIAFGHPFADGNKRTSYALLLSILSKLYEKDILLDAKLAKKLTITIAEMSGESEDEEKDIVKLQKIIEEIISTYSPYT